jgi:PAS domain-containing protein
MLAARVAMAIETAKVFAEEALQRAWLQTILDQMPEAVVLLDEHGRVRALNPALSALSCGETGATDPYGNPRIFDLRAPDGSVVPFEKWPVIRALEAGEASIGEDFLLRQRDGRMVPILVNASPVRSPAGPDHRRHRARPGHLDAQGARAATRRVGCRRGARPASARQRHLACGQLAAQAS